MKKDLQVTVPPCGAGLIDEKEILRRVPVSRRTLNNWKTKGVMPYIKIGRRCLYHWGNVEAALLRRQRGGVEQ